LPLRAWSKELVIFGFEKRKVKLFEHSYGLIFNFRGRFWKGRLREAMQRMKTMVADAKYIIPGHDAQVFSKFPAVADGIVEIK
jgi:hypothetical protein